MTRDSSLRKGHADIRCGSLAQGLVSLSTSPSRFGLVALPLSVSWSASRVLSVALFPPSLSLALSCSLYPMCPPPAPASLLWIAPLTHRGLRVSSPSYVMWAGQRPSTPSLAFFPICPMRPSAPLSLTLCPSLPPSSPRLLFSSFPSASTGRLPGDKPPSAFTPPVRGGRRPWTSRTRRRRQAH